MIPNEPKSLGSIQEVLAHMTAFIHRTSNTSMPSPAP